MTTPASQTTLVKACIQVLLDAVQPSPFQLRPAIFLASEVIMLHCRSGMAYVDLQLGFHVAYLFNGGRKEFWRQVLRNLQTVAVVNDHKLILFAKRQSAPGGGPRCHTTSCDDNFAWV